MKLSRRALVTATAATLATTGCLHDGDTEEDDEPADGEETMDDGDETTAATVEVESHPDLGDVLVDSEGMTLYMFDQDERGAGESTCSGGCAEAWPPVTVDDAPVAGDDVSAELTTFQREDGSRQLVASGWPLYYYADDAEPGDASGQGANDVWWVLRSDGSPVREQG